MDMESPNSRHSKLVQRWKKTSFVNQRLLSNHEKPPRSDVRNENHQEVNVEVNMAPPSTKDLEIDPSFLHGMPWKSSIDPKYAPNTSPYYISFWEHQLQFMKDNLTNLKVLPTVSAETGAALGYRENYTDYPMRMHTMQFSSDEFRLIRLTVMDAGVRTQVFTSVWYPQPEYNTPIMGIDLLQFGQKKHLCIMDFQPIDQEDDHEEPVCEYEHLMAPIRDQYPSLQGKMTPRFYDENSFFSSQMLLGRQDDPVEADRMVKQDLFPAFQGYLQTYMDLHTRTIPRPHQASLNLQRHHSYDVYSAERDPAHGLLAKCFGQDFADDYVYNILFPLSKGAP